MEARNITIVNSRTQSRNTFSSTAETLGELKADLDRLEIDYSNLTFFEGISKTELTDDNAILPKDLPWKGERTNDLVFMLTESQKRIRNGAMSRSDLYNYIKNNNLQEEVKTRFGRNFTQCSTADLLSMVEGSIPADALEGVSSTECECAPALRAASREVKRTSSQRVKNATNHTYINHNDLVSLLVNKGILTEDEVVMQVAPCKFSDKDIDEMFANM